MQDTLLLLIGTILVNNVVLSKFLGLCPFMGVSGKIDTALGMGFATTFVLTLTAILVWITDNAILLPLDLGYLRLMTFILLIASVVQLTELYVRKSFPALYQSLGVFLPLISTNCAVLGVALLVSQQSMSFVQTVIYGFGSALGFTLVLVLFAGIRERLKLAQVPAAMQGTPIAFITAGLLSMAFMGFAGWV